MKVKTNVQAGNAKLKGNFHSLQLTHPISGSSLSIGG